jgi:hypothetical protein
MTRFLDTLPGDVSPGIREKQRPGATPLEEAKRETPPQSFREKNVSPFARDPLRKRRRIRPAGWRRWARRPLTSNSRGSGPRKTTCDRPDCANNLRVVTSVLLPACATTTTRCTASTPRRLRPELGDR